MILSLTQTIQTVKNKKGYLLIEFLISVAIFTIFITAISKLQLLSLQLKDLANKKLAMLEKGVNYIENNKKEKKISICNDLNNNTYNSYSVQERDLLILQKFKFKLIELSGKTLINKKAGKNCSIKLIKGEELV